MKIKSETVRGAVVRFPGWQMKLYYDNFFWSSEVAQSFSG